MTLSNAPRNGQEFEQQTAVLLERVLPHCYLQGVPIFRADAAMATDSMANELDFIVHLKQGRRHTLLIIECKSCRVTGKGDGRGNFTPPTPSSHWLAHYRDGKEKPIKDQLRAQRQALLTNLEPLDGEVLVHAVVVASQLDGIDVKPGFITTQELPSFELSLVRSERFEEYLKTLIAVAIPLRVQQSEILRRIRQGQPVPTLGHPEIYNAIEYTRRCRAFIDSEIFRHLNFKPERWAINGSAGMGKSVLLIYATMVFITDRFIACLRDGSRFLQSFTEDASKISLAPLDKRRVWVISHSEKQRDMLERMFDRFNELYGEVDCYNEYRRVKPEFHVFSEVANIDCNILLVDEAHDLGTEGEKRVREWHESNPDNYLVIACDRHQKLRLAQDETRMIQGINFSRCTKKLSRNYRNPFPAYAGSIGLLFRWFALTGPKTLPKPKELLGEFGFGEAMLERPGVWLLRSRNDAHPANNWSHTLSTFPSAEAAYQQLSEFPLRKEHVLWVRFSPEESDFNYENLQHWSYHSVYGADASDLLDKYVKGQEFPVVVIEGVPEMFSWSTASNHHPQDPVQARIKMWQARRQLYLAASRANVFLYFILPPNTPADVVEEFKAMFQQLAHQPEQYSPSGTLWDIRITETSEIETFDSYVDAIEADTVPEPSDREVHSTGSESLPIDPKHTRAIQLALPVKPPSPPVVSEPVVASPQIDPLPVAKETQLAEASGLLGLGQVATIAEVAKAVGVDVSVVTRKLAAHGYQQLHSTAPVRVQYVLGLLREPDSDEPPGPKPPVADSSAEAEPIEPQPGETSSSVQLEAAPAASPSPLPNSAITVASLGKSATLSAVARALGKEVAELSQAMAAKGFKVEASSMVSVPFVLGIMNGTALSQTLNPSVEFAPPTSTPQQPLKLQLVKHYAMPTKPPVTPQKTAQQPPKPEYAPAQPIRLNDLGSRFHLPGKLLSSFFEAEGVSIVSSNQILQPAEVEKVVRRICPKLGMAGFKKLYSARIKVKEIANYFGRRPVEVARDLSPNQLQLKPDDFAPYESVVRLCFHYRKPLPRIVDKG